MDRRGQDHKFAISPNLEFKYLFGPRFSIEAGVAYTVNPIDEQRIFTGVVMRNYKYLMQGRTDLKQLPGYRANIELDFKDPISGWYLKGSAAWTAGRTFEMTRYFLGNDYIVNVQSNKINSYSIIAASAEISKAFMALGGKITGDFDFSRYTSSILQNEILIDYVGDTYTAELRYTGGVTNWLSVQYSGIYTYSLYSTGEKNNRDDNHDMSHSLTLSFFPAKSIEFDVSGEYYFNKYQTYSPSHNFFIDFSFWYFVTPKLQLFIHAKNLLDERTYTQTFVNPLEISHNTYKIRPLNILLGIQVNF